MPGSDEMNHRLNSRFLLVVYFNNYPCTVPDSALGIGSIRLVFICGVLFITICDNTLDRLHILIVQNKTTNKEPRNKQAFYTGSELRLKQESRVSQPD